MKRILYYDELDDLPKLIRAHRDPCWPLTIGLTGGFFNPVHSGHIKLFADSRKFCNLLIVAINNDECAETKCGYSFLPLKERMEIVSEFRSVDIVIENPNMDMVELIKRISPKVYLKGGDVNKENINDQERQVCLEVNCEIIFNVGGAKIVSSRDFLQDYYNFRYYRTRT